MGPGLSASWWLSGRTRQGEVPGGGAYARTCAPSLCPSGGLQILALRPLGWRLAQLGSQAGAQAVPGAWRHQTRHDHQQFSPCLVVFGLQGTQFRRWVTGPKWREHLPDWRLRDEVSSAIHSEVRARPWIWSLPRAISHLPYCCPALSFRPGCWGQKVGVSLLWLASEIAEPVDEREGHTRI